MDANSRIYVHYLMAVIEVHLYSFNYRDKFLGISEQHILKFAYKRNNLLVEYFNWKLTF